MAHRQSRLRARSGDDSHERNRAQRHLHARTEAGWFTHAHRRAAARVCAALGNGEQPRVKAKRALRICFVLRFKQSKSRIDLEIPLASYSRLRQTAPSMKTKLALFLCASNLVAFADGPGDNLPDKVRRVPPPGIAISAMDRSELEAGAAELGKSIEALR